MENEKYYPVLNGRINKVCRDEEEAISLTIDYPDGLYVPCDSKDEAEAAIEQFFIGTPIHEKGDTGYLKSSDTK